MLIKQLFQDRDFRKTLRRRLVLQVGMTALGVVLIILSLTVLTHSDLSDFAQGVYLGAGSGLALAGLFFAIRTARLLKHPDAARKAEISERDEREQAIIAAAMRAVFWAFYAVLSFGLFVALPLNRTVFNTFLALFLVMTAVFFGAVLWYRKHM